MKIVPSRDTILISLLQLFYPHVHLFILLAEINISAFAITNGRPDLETYVEPSGISTMRFFLRR